MVQEGARLHLYKGTHELNVLPGRSYKEIYHSATLTCVPTLIRLVFGILLSRFRIIPLLILFFIVELLRIIRCYGLHHENLSGLLKIRCLLRTIHTC